MSFGNNVVRTDVSLFLATLNSFGTQLVNKYFKYNGIETWPDLSRYCAVRRVDGGIKYFIAKLEAGFNGIEWVTDEGLFIAVEDLDKWEYLAHKGI